VFTFENIAAQFTLVTKNKVSQLFSARLLNDAEPIANNRENYAYKN